jgi:hypothetical protein
MDKKYWFFGSKLNTGLLLVLIVLMVIALKWMSENKEMYYPSSLTQASNSIEKIQSTNTDGYEEGSPLYEKLKTVLTSEGLIGDVHPIGVYEVKDITGDGIPELLVYTGVSGATTDFYTVVKVDNGEPEVVNIQESNGKIRKLSGSRGAGGSDRYGSSLEMLPDQKSILSSSYSVYGLKDDNCSSDIYTWNPKTKLFEYNKAITDVKTKEIMKTCANIATETGVRYQNK